METIHMYKPMQSKSMDWFIYARDLRHEGGNVLHVICCAEYELWTQSAQHKHIKLFLLNIILPNITYTPWKQKIVRFFNVFTGYKNEILGTSGLI